MIFAKQFLCVFVSLSCLATGAAARVVDQEAEDIRLVAAQISQQVVKFGEGDSADVQLTNCTETSRSPNYSHGVYIYDSVSYACRRALSAYLNSPVLGDIGTYTSMKPGTSSMVYPGIALSGRRVDLYTAVRQAAMAPAAGIGFYYGFHESFVERSALREFTNASTPS